jgi:hypothetical protein
MIRDVSSPFLGPFSQWALISLSKRRPIRLSGKAVGKTAENTVRRSLQSRASIQSVNLVEASTCGFMRKIRWIGHARRLRLRSCGSYDVAIETIGPSRDRTQRLDGWKPSCCRPKVHLSRYDRVVPCVRCPRISALCTSMHARQWRVALFCNNRTSGDPMNDYSERQRDRARVRGTLRTRCIDSDAV